MQKEKYENETDEKHLQRRNMMRSVGRLREASALMGTDQEIVIVGPRGRPHPDLPKLRVVWVYPDTTDQDGAWNSTLKIEVELI